MIYVWILDENILAKFKVALAFIMRFILEYFNEPQKGRC
jgi:hypothetical protein